APAAIEADVAGVGGFWAAYGQSLMLLLLLFGAFFAFYGNGAVLWRVARGNLKMIGGSLTHVGFALMLLGIIGSSVFNDPITDGAGADIRGDRDNFIIHAGETKRVEGHTVTYAGTLTNERGRPVYAIDFEDPRGRSFRATAEVYQSKTEQWIQHPHVEPFFESDVYVAVYPSAMMGQPETAPGELVLRRGEAVRLDGGAFAVRFTDYDLDVDTRAAGLADSLDLAVGAVLEVTDTRSGETRTVRPVYAIRTDRTQTFAPAGIPEWGLGFTFAGMRVESDAVQLVVEGAEVAQSDWIVVQAYRKPFISLLWFGTLVLMVGFSIAIVRRATEARPKRAA
ncbi:MAG: cytochrome C assembly protein, partial [Rhodothermales bacterium]|nr:cytochrome C assembly protein [Rhodothermales bacterium]